MVPTHIFCAILSYLVTEHWEDVMKKESSDLFLLESGEIKMVCIICPMVFKYEEDYSYEHCSDCSLSVRGATTWISKTSLVVEWDRYDADLIYVGVGNYE